MLNEVIHNILFEIQKEQNISKDIYYIRSIINSLILNLHFNEQIQYLTHNKGKNIRSLLSLHYFYKYKTNNSYNIDLLYQIIAIIELTHLASLLHDDVIDNSEYRRNEKSFNFLYGNKNSILTGDYLLISNVKKLLNILRNKKYGQYIIDQFIKASSDTAYGAYLENNLKYGCSSKKLNQNISNKSVINNYDIYPIHRCIDCYFANNDIQQYIRIASLKTGSLFKFSCICGCVLSNADFNNIKQSAIFGLIFGIIYQIQNDLNDYKCNNYIESEDYIQSNITLPIIILNYLFDIKQIFNNKTQENFLHIKQLINTNKFNKLLNNIVNKYLNRIYY